MLIESLHSLMILQNFSASSSATRRKEDVVINGDKAETTGRGYAGDFERKVQGRERERNWKRVKEPGVGRIFWDIRDWELIIRN